MNLFTNQKQNHRCGKQTWLPRGINSEIQIDKYTRLHITQTTNKSLLYGTENSTEYSTVTYIGIGSKKEGIYV